MTFEERLDDFLQEKSTLRENVVRFVPYPYCLEFPVVRHGIPERIFFGQLKKATPKSLQETQQVWAQHACASRGIYRRVSHQELARLEEIANNDEPLGVGNVYIPRYDR